MADDKFNDLVRKLKEIFQIDKPELDFGIYRILNARRKEIEGFLDDRFKNRVEEAINASLSAERDAVEAELRKAEENARALGADPDTLPKIKELRDKLSALASAANDAESLVYAHLLAFFSRYYEDGDFISQRRYKEGVYAIPYSGEEVKLHWANTDQYYTKTGESFTNYDFPLDGGLRVRFHLVSADTAKDNVKDNDAVRCFKLWNPADTPEYDPDDEEEAERIKALYPADFIEEKDGELIIHFQYLKFPKSQKQKELLDTTEAAIKGKLSDAAEWTRWAALFGTVSKDDKRSVLRKNLDRYAAKNSSDYFIHKNLGKFLRRELDFYVKNEMMHLDEVDRDATGESIVAHLRTIRTFRAVAHELIDFMAQLEDFQKKLWLKRKFVVQCDWCLTMDLVPEELRGEVLANKAQQEEWKRLGVDADPKATNLTAVDARMVDTKFFDEDFKAKLLAAIPDLDERTDGVLVHSENFQALRLMKERYREQVKCIYIDPPYNTGNDGFLYKDGCSHSSWLSMMEDRILDSRSLLQNNAAVFLSIDDNEQSSLRALGNSIFGEDLFLAHASRKRRDSQANLSKNISPVHEYVAIWANSHQTSLHKVSATIDESGYKNPDNDPRGPYTTMPCTNRGGSSYPITTPTGKIIVDEWRFTQETFEQLRSDNRIVFPRKGDGKPRYKLFLQEKEEEGVLANTWWDFLPSNQEATTELESFFGTSVFSMPKPAGLVKFCCELSTESSSFVLDYFAGSGTTGHAVIDLNRQDREKGINANRKYILVEMGEHFETVLKPRIEKVVYSPKWKDGKPENADKGISHCFKYLTLESYEDTLNNLELKKPEGAASDLLGSDEYLLRYMLDVEARGSLLSTDDFRHPFDYEMKIATDSSGAYARRRIDLVETFNWLVGLRVESEERLIDSRSCVLVEGTLPNGEKALVAWRDVDKVDSAALSALLKSQGYLTDGEEKPAKEVNVLFVNGDHSLRPVISAETGETKVRSIEDEFLSRMFGEEH